MRADMAASSTLEARRQIFYMRLCYSRKLFMMAFPAQTPICSVPKLLNGALKQNLIVLDELGFIPFSVTAAHLIFQFCSALYQKVARCRPNVKSGSLLVYQKHMRKTPGSARWLPHSIMGARYVFL
jgi:hypothetical protein